MFNSLKQKYDIYTSQIVLDEYKQEIETPIFAFNLTMAISLMSHNQYTANDMRLSQTTHVAVANKSDISKGMKIWQDDKMLYIVEFVHHPSKREDLIYLKAVV